MASEQPTWADQLEAWATLGAAVVALAAAVATIWLLIHQIGEANRARADAAKERSESAVDRELARQDRDFAAQERRDNEMAQARVVILDYEATLFATPRRPTVRIEGHVTNFSDRPVLNVQVTYEATRNDEAMESSLLSAVTLPPGATQAFEIQIAREELAGARSFRRAMPGARLTVEFTDTNGRRWRRTDNGAPIRQLSA